MLVGLATESLACHAPTTARPPQRFLLLAVELRSQCSNMIINLDVDALDKIQAYRQAMGTALNVGRLLTPATP